MCHVGEIHGEIQWNSLGFVCAIAWASARRPLSSFLFLFVADGLSALLKNNVASGDNTPIKVCRSAPRISHLLFTDDTLLFFGVSKTQTEKVKAVLDLYGTAIGQSLNYDKCSLLFGEACPGPVQEEVRTALHVTNHLF